MLSQNQGWSQGRGGMVRTLCGGGSGLRSLKPGMGPEAGGAARRGETPGLSREVPQLASGGG